MYGLFRVELAVARPQYTHAAQVEVQARMFLLGDIINTLVGSRYGRKRKAEMHQQFAVLVALPEDNKHVHVVVRGA